MLPRLAIPGMLLLAACAPMQRGDFPAGATPDSSELTLAGGRLRIVNLYRVQGDILRASRGQPADTVVERMVRRVFLPHANFWNGYLGDEAAFREWTVKLLAADHPIHSRLEPLTRVGLDRRFTEGAAWLERTTGRKPAGTWYIVFGPGWTDMGSLTDIGMVADFTQMRPDSAAIANILPHELSHQVQGASPERAADPDAGTVLERIVNEGFASYVSWVHGEGKRTPAEALGYREADWTAAVAHEPALVDAVRPILASRERKNLDRVASRSARLIDGTPGAAGYFIGFRIVQAYVVRHGADSWKEIYDLPVRTVVERSGYSLF